MAKSSITAFEFLRTQTQTGFRSRRTVSDELFRMETPGGSIYLSKSALERAGDGSGIWPGKRISPLRTTPRKTEPCAHTTPFPHRLRRGGIFLYPFEVKPLNYAYDALEPYISQQIMHLHHDKHLKTYVDNLNQALGPCPQLHGLGLKRLIVKAPSLPRNLRIPISRNAGGVYNHQFFFDSLQPPAGQQPTGTLEGALTRCFGSVSEFREQFKKAALSVFGSGYAWLVRCGDGRLRIITTANQETPLTRGMQPILNLDVWEHAYYLQYYNVRADYVDNGWNIVNWEMAQLRYENAPHSVCHAERSGLSYF